MAEQGSNGDSSKKAFFTTLPGILGGVAAVITAIVGAVALFVRDDDKPPDSVTIAPTSVTTVDSVERREAWARSANAICEETTDRLNALSEPQDLEEASANLDFAVNIANQALARFRSLQPPPGQETAVERMIGLLERSLASYRNAFRSLNSGDSETANELIREAEVADQRASEIARQLGAHQCDL